MKSKIYPNITFKTSTALITQTRIFASLEAS